jgi:hypothetical protein
MYTQGQAIEFIERCFGSATLTNGGLNASVVCPKCAEKEDNLQKRKLVVRTDDFLTHCWVCGYRSTNLINLLATYHPHFIEEYREKFKIQQPFTRCMTFDLDKLFSDKEDVVTVAPEVKLPTGFTLIATNLGQHNKAVEDGWKYLKSRGVTESELWYWKFGVTDFRTPKGEPNYRFRIIVPSFDASGNVNYFSARAYWKDLKGAKYSNPKVKRETIIFNELNIDWSQELTLVEGVFDLIKCNENATCLLGSSLDQTYLLFQRIVERNTPIALALDNDARHKTFKLAKMLTEYGISVRIFQVPPDLNDVGQMTKSRFIAELPNAKTFSSADYLRYKLGDL